MDDPQQFTAQGLAKRAERFGLGTADEIARVIRHYTNQGLLTTVGRVNTGKGTPRTYQPDAWIQGVILLHFNRLTISVGVIKELVRGMRDDAKERYGSPDLLEACRGRKHPCVVFSIPKKRPFKGKPAIVEKSEAFTAGRADVLIFDLKPYVT
jgi:DNA-binding transcriptional MerR regulator